MMKADITMTDRQYIILLSSLYAIFMASVAVYSFAAGNRFSVSVGLAGILCGAVPVLLTVLTRLKFDLPIVIAYLIFLFGAQFLGSVLDWYRISWWDLLMHGISGAILAFLAIALYKKLVYQRADGQISSGFLFLFILSFSALCGLLWETYEFSSDQLFGTVMQADNTDTMTDLISGMIGALIIALWTKVRSK